MKGHNAMLLQRHGYTRTLWSATEARTGWDALPVARTSTIRLHRGKQLTAPCEIRIFFEYCRDAAVACREVDHHIRRMERAFRFWKPSHPEGDSSMTRVLTDAGTAIRGMMERVMTAS